jgi:hypothetical protein
VVLGVVVGVVLGVVDGVVLGVVDGEDGVEPLHVVPLTLNDVGAALVPL